jgi:hypothetical protein
MGPIRALSAAEEGDGGEASPRAKLKRYGRMPSFIVKLCADSAFWRRLGTLHRSPINVVRQYDPSQVNHGRRSILEGSRDSFPGGVENSLSVSKPIAVIGDDARQLSTITFKSNGMISALDIGKVVAIAATHRVPPLCIDLPGQQL